MVTPASDTLIVAGTKIFSAVVQDANGSPISDRVIRWISSLPAVASVDDKGLVTAIGRGETVISAQADGVIGTALLAVRDRFDRLVIKQRFPSVFVADTTRLTVIGIDYAGREQVIDAVQWEVADALVAQIGPAGVATGTTAGSTYVRARVDALIDSTELVVVPKRIGPSREIAYMRRFPPWDIFAELWIGVDSMSARRVSAAERSVHSFAWSPDGSLLGINYGSVQVEKPPLFEILNVDTGERRSFAMFAGNPSFSPDNQRVAFEHLIGSDFMIATMAIDGSDLRWVNDLPGTELVPKWSPDGRRLTFISNLGDGRVEVWWMRADLKGAQRVSPGFFARNPEWSPDGKWLTFDDEDRVWLADPDGGSVRSLSESGVPGFLRWSPSGTEVMYSVLTGGLYDPSIPAEVRVVRTDGTILSRYPTPILNFESAFTSFSSDGKQVAIPRLHGNEVKIIVSNLDGSGDKVVSLSTAYLPWWRP